jgi:hypothetical protein
MHEPQEWTDDMLAPLPARPRMDQDNAQIRTAQLDLWRSRLEVCANALRPTGMDSSHLRDEEHEALLRASAHIRSARIILSPVDKTTPCPVDRKSPCP